MSWFSALASGTGAALTRAGASVKATAQQVVTNVKSAFAKAPNPPAPTCEAAKARVSETYVQAKAADSKAACKVENAVAASTQAFTPKPAAPVLSCSVGAGAPLSPDKRTPCDLANFTIKATGGDHKEHAFTTAVRLAGKAVPPDTPKRAAEALDSVDFYIEVLGSDGGPGAQGSVASLTSTASYAAKCGSEQHRTPTMVDAEKTPLLQPVTGRVMIPGPISGTARRDVRSLVGGSSHDYSVFASSCGNPVAAGAAGKPVFNALVKVFPFQDWSIKFVSPSGFSVGYEREGGHRSAVSRETKVLGSTVSRSSASRDAYGTVTRTTGSSSKGYYDERTLTVTTTSGGQNASMTRSASVSGFFTREEISEKISREGDGPYVTSPVDYEKSADARGMTFEVLRNGKPVVNTATLMKDVETVLAAMQDFVDVLKGLPKAGYWLEGSASFLAITAQYDWKRKPLGHKGPRSVTIGNEWALKLSGRLVKASLEVGAGVKMQALATFSGGAELYAYLAGSVEMGLSVSKQWSGVDDPAERPPEPAAKGEVEFEGKVHGKASVAGWGYEYQRSASVKGEIEATPQLVEGGAKVTLRATLGRWRYKVVVQTDPSGIPEEYEIDDLWALKPKRLTEDQASAKDNDPKWTRTWTLLFQSSAPYLQSIQP